jgi:hypothetical protein
MSKYYIGIDNGVSGSVGILTQNGELIHFGPTPVFSQLSYTKSKMRMRTRIAVEQLMDVFTRNITVDHQAKAFIERPMINPMRFQASISAACSMEATLIVLDRLEIGYEWCDSRAWQKLLLPSGCKGDDLKIASRDIGVRLFPQVQGLHTDCDGLLIAEWARRTNI